MSILLSENKSFSFQDLITHLSHCFCGRSLMLSGIPDAPWISNRTRKRAYRATVVQVDTRCFQVRITERLGAYSQEYQFRSLYTSIENKTFSSARAAYRVGLALTQQLALARYAWCR